MLRSSIPLETDDTYLPEVWAYYVLGTIVILLRYAVRIRTVGIRSFQGDDYMTLLAFVLYTMNAIIVQITYYTGGNLDVTPEMVDSLSEEDIRILTVGSQLEFASWYTYPGLIWCLKFIVLFFYKRLTMGAMKRRTILFLFWLCGLSYLAQCLMVTFSCQPYSHNWQIRPLPGEKCRFRSQNFYVLVVLNVVTDAAIMCIPVPLLWRLRVTLLRKVGVSILLSSGVFIISTAILRAVLTIGGKPSVININRWGFRETVVGLVAVTAPVLSPLFTRSFWRPGPYQRNRYRLEMEEAMNRPDLGNVLGTVEIRSALEDLEEGIAQDAPQASIWKRTFTERTRDGHGVRQIYNIHNYSPEKTSRSWGKPRGWL